MPAGSGAICMAVYKPDPEMLARQVATIRAQSLRDWTCVVGIDGRDERAHRWLLLAVDGDPRFVVHEFSTRVGHYRNFERTLAAAPLGVAWHAFADQDDLWLPDKLESLLIEMRATGATAITGTARVVTSGGEVQGLTARQPARLPALVYDNQVTGSLAVFDATVAGMALPFPAPTAVAYHDHWLGCVAAALGEVRSSDRIVQDYIQHAANVVGEPAPDVRRRLVTLFGRGNGTSALDVLAFERWGWRVTIARELTKRVPGVADEVTVLGDIAGGPGTLAVLRSLLVATLRGRVDRGRGVGLMIGAIAWRIRRRRRPLA